MNNKGTVYDYKFIGLTDVQYKRMLHAEWKNWQKFLGLAVAAGNTEFEEKIIGKIMMIENQLSLLAKKTDKEIVRSGCRFL